MTAFTATIWRHDGAAAWHFVTLPPEVADELRARTAHRPKPFGVVPVTAAIDATAWETSVFWDTKAGSYLLPVKAAVRRAQRLEDGQEVAVTLTVLGPDV